ncbi:hypothetical protein DIPPA_08347 [Diplonema papillatum]|nr:hypothetical protein DIPPA_08347 [Diplonema papillatum]
MAFGAPSQGGPAARAGRPTPLETKASSSDAAGAPSSFPDPNVAGQYRDADGFLKNPDGVVIGAQAVHGLNLPPIGNMALNIKPAKGVAWLRAGEKINRAKQPQARVLVLHMHGLLVSDMRGTMKRYMKLPEIRSVTVQPVAVKGTAKPVWQIHAVAADEHDLLFRLTESKYHNTDVDDDCRNFCEMYSLIASKFFGRPIRVDRKLENGDLSASANLVKSKNWKPPAQYVQPNGRRTSATPAVSSPANHSNPDTLQKPESPTFARVSSMNTTFMPPIARVNSTMVQQPGGPFAVSLTNTESSAGRAGDAVTTQSTRSTDDQVPASLQLVENGNDSVGHQSSSQNLASPRTFAKFTALSGSEASKLLSPPLLTATSSKAPSNDTSSNSSADDWGPIMGSPKRIPFAEFASLIGPKASEGYASPIPSSSPNLAACTSWDQFVTPPLSSPTFRNASSPLRGQQLSAPESPAFRLSSSPLRAQPSAQDSPSFRNASSPLRPQPSAQEILSL